MTAQQPAAAPASTSVAGRGGDQELVDLATFLRVAEPGVPSLVRHVRRVGVAQTLDDIRRGARIPDVDVAALAHRLKSASGAADLQAAADVGARLINPTDPDWPPALDDLRWVDRDCLGLWVRGSTPLADACARAIAVVGTRAATDYGVTIAGDMSWQLAQLGWTIVSGLAYGIDAAAHRGALAAGGLTVGVLACGIDSPYPKGHRSLYERIAESGAVVTEHPPGAAPQRPRFLIRNRIIAALAAGTVVVEMAPRSGARSTATHAALINRHVMCVPGPVTSTMSAGCHQFLRERPESVLVTRGEEVVEQCGHIGELAPRLTGPSRTRDQLGPTIARVLEALPVRRHASVEAIARAAGLSVETTSAALAALVAARLAEQVDGGWRMTTEARRDRTARRAEAANELPLDWW